MNPSVAILLSVLLATSIVVITNTHTVLAAKHHKNASNSGPGNSTSGSNGDNDNSSSHKNIPTSNSTVSPSSGTNSTTTPTIPIENNKEQAIKDGPIGICSVGVKSACNGPAFDYPWKQ